MTDEALTGERDGAATPEALRARQRFVERMIDSPSMLHDDLPGEEQSDAIPFAAVVTAGLFAAMLARAHDSLCQSCSVNAQFIIGKAFTEAMLRFTPTAESVEAERLSIN